MSHVSHMPPTHAYSAGISIHVRLFPPQVGLTTEKRRRRKTVTASNWAQRARLPLFLFKRRRWECSLRFTKRPAPRQPLRVSGHSCVKLDATK